MVRDQGHGGHGLHWYAVWKRHEAALRRQFEERQAAAPARTRLPHVYMVDIAGLWKTKDGVEQRVGHQARCAFSGCGWSAQPHTGDLEAAWTAAKADRDAHQRAVLRAGRADRENQDEDEG